MAFNKKLTFEGLQYYHSKIKTLFSNVNKSISDETTRATTKENEIANNLSVLETNLGDLKKEEVDNKIESEVATDFSQADTPQFQQTIDDVLNNVNELKGDIVNKIGAPIGLKIEPLLLSDSEIKPINFTVADTKYGYVTDNNITVINEFSFLFKLTSGFTSGQFCIDLNPNNEYTDIYLQIKAKNNLSWIRLTSDKTSTIGQTLINNGKEYKGYLNVTTNKYLYFNTGENEFDIVLNIGTTAYTYHLNSNYLQDNKWKDKKLYCLGDSITANTNAWLPIVKNELELSEIVNAGVGGTTIANNGSDNWFGTRISPNIANYDAIYVMGGTNDMGQSIPIGQIEYNTETGYNTSNFKSAIAYLIQQIQIVAPKIKIIFGTPCNGRGQLNKIEYNEFKNSIGLGTSDYSKAIKDVCELYGIPVVDVFGTSGINGLNRLDYIADTVHPNEEGQKLLGKCIANGLENISTM